MNNRPVASLSPTLLARKGAARPAMRPQLQPLRAFQQSAAPQLDDLGWNDMGQDCEAESEATEIEVEQEQEQEQPTAEIVAFNPSVEFTPIPRQRDEIVERVTPSRRSALEQGRRAAFTLRLDSERHLKLRLACVTSNRSAQQLVTEALDRLIAELPEVAELAAKVGKRR